MKHKTLRTLLCVILTVCFCLSAIAPVSAAGLFSGDTGAASIFDEWIRSLKDRFIEKNPGTDETPAEPLAGAGEEFIRIFHLDCGRRYFSVDEINGIIDELAANHYTHIELGFGNGGFRFLLDEADANGNPITITANGTTYNLSDVNTAIHSGNVTYSNGCSYTPDKHELTQSDMDEIISHANDKGIGIIPLMDIPGHSNALIDAMNHSSINLNVTSHTTGKNIYNVAMRAFEITDTKAVSFVTALAEKYIDYFASKGCKYFNLGADECGYTLHNNYIYGQDEYLALANMLNTIGNYIVGKSMTPMIFNDGFRQTNGTDYLKTKLSEKFVVCYWTESGYTKAAELATKFKVVNTHNGWYYVIGNNNSSWAGFDTANGNFKTIKCTSCDSGYTTNYGCMFAVWCDDPSKKPDYEDRIYPLIRELANQNPDYFKAPVTPAAPTITVSANSLTVDGTATLSTSDGSLATWASSDEKVLVLEVVATKDVVVATKDVTAASVTVRAVGAGTATVTAKLSDGTTLTSEMITVRNKGEVTDEERTVTVTVGQTLTLPETISGQYDGTQENEFAKVVAESQPISNFTKTTSYTNGGEFYISTNSNDSAPTIQITIESDGYGSYYLKNADGQYIYPSRTRSGRGYSYSLKYGRQAVGISVGLNGEFTISRGNAYLSISDGSLTSESGNEKKSLYLYSKNSSGTNYETVVTVTGKKVTTAPVEMIVGTVKYLITVTAEDLSSVTPLPIQLWQTNTTVEPDANYAGQRTSGYFGVRSPYYVNVKAENAYGENGVALADVLPDDMYRYENDGTYLIAEQTGKKKMELVIWSGRVHNNNNFQEFWSTDYSNSGDEFNYIRYFDKKWQVSKTRENDSWITVTGNGSTTSSSACSEQLVVYYMMRTTITKEVTTDVADWGFVKGDTDYAGQVGSDKNYVLLDFAVKYQDGTRNPNDFPKTEKTLAFHCNSGSSGVLANANGSYRQLNNFRAFDTSSDYEVYMVTVTMTDDSQSNTIANTESYTYGGLEKIIWAIDAETYANSELPAYTAITSGDSTYSFDETRCIGGDPYVRGVEVYNKHGALITYYARAKKLPDQTITVHYIDKDTNTEFFSYDIIVKNGTVFDAEFKLVNGVLDPNHNKVTNSLGFEQTISSELKDMLSVPAQYRRWLYTCVDAFTKDPYKDAYLYYTFNNRASFVVDFGLPLVIQPTQVSVNLAGATIQNVVPKGNKYGDITFDSDGNVTYTLRNKTLDEADSFSLFYTGVIDGGTTASTVEYAVSIIPASNVYYEETFMTPSGSNSWGTSTAPTTKQTTELGGAKTYVYGYEQELVKGNTTNYSGNSAYVANLNLPADKKSVYTKDNLTFSFTGAGFDLISECGKDTGMVVVRLENAKTKEAKVYIIDTYFHGDDAILNNTHNIYQTPVIRELALVYGTYNVTIRGALYKNSGTVVNQPAAADVSTYSMQASAFAVETETFDIRAFLDDCGFEDVSVDDVELVYMDENSVLNGGTGIQSEAAAPVERSAAFSTYAMNVETEAASSTEARVTIDGFRVYNPLKDGSDVYTTDNESGVKYNDLSKYIQSNSTTGALPTETKNVMYVEYNSELKQAESANYNSKPFGTNGPKYEIYLAPNCGIAVGLPNDFTEKDILQLSAKIVSGTPTLKIGKNDGSFKEITVGNQNAGLSLTGTEMYYDISDCIQQTTDGKKFITIINGTSAGEQKGSQSVLAVNVLKMSENKATNEMSEETQNYILASLTESMATPIDDTFEPEVFEIYAPTTARRNRTFSISANVSVTDLEKVTIAADDGTETELNALNRVSVKWGISSEYFYLKTFRMRDSGEHTFKITAYGKDGSSVSKTVTVLVK